MEKQKPFSNLNEYEKEFIISKYKLTKKEYFTKGLIIGFSITLVTCVVIYKIFLGGN